MVQALQENARNSIENKELKGPILEHSNALAGVNGHILTQDNLLDEVEILSGHLF